MAKNVRWWFPAVLAGMALVPSRALFCGDTRGAFDRAVAELRDTPDDLALRKRVIRLSLELPALPAVPDDVAVLEGKAVYAAKSATQPSDYLEAVDAYKSAALLAPWDGTLYYNQAGMEQQAGRPGDAIRDFKLYLLATPGASDRVGVLARIGKLELLQDKNKQARVDAAAARRLAAVNAQAYQVWQDKENAGKATWVTGMVAIVVGGSVAAWGWGTVAGTSYTVAPGYSGGVDYNIPYEGKYWSSASYNAYTSGVQDEEIGGIVLVAGIVAVVVGAVMEPGPFVQQTALLNVRDGGLALGVPPVTLMPHGQGWRGTLLSAEF